MPLPRIAFTSHCRTVTTSPSLHHIGTMPLCRNAIAGDPALPESDHAIAGSPALPLCRDAARTAHNRADCTIEPDARHRDSGVRHCGIPAYRRCGISALRDTGIAGYRHCGVATRRDAELNYFHFPLFQIAGTLAAPPHHTLLGLWCWMVSRIAALPAAPLRHGADTLNPAQTRQNPYNKQ